MMIPFANYSIKVSYLFVLVAFKVYVTITVTLVPMLNNCQMPIDAGQNELPRNFVPMLKIPEEIRNLNGPIVLGCYTFATLYKMNEIPSSVLKGSQKCKKSNKRKGSE